MVPIQKSRRYNFKQRNPTKEKFPPHFAKVISPTRKTGFLAEVHIELMTKSNICVTNEPHNRPFLRS